MKAIPRWPGRILAAIAVLLASSQTASANVAQEVLKLTGRRTKIVWLRSVNGWSGLPGWRSHYALMGLDTDEGKEREILPGPASYANPWITSDGTRVIYSDVSKKVSYVVDWDGRNKRPLAKAPDYYVLCYWRDPKSGVEWAYVGDHYYKVTSRELASNNVPGTAVYRVRLDDPSRKELVWKRTRISLDWRVSADGTRGGGGMPWRHVGVADLREGSWKRYTAGCCPQLAPDNSLRMFTYIGGHNKLVMFDAGGVNKRHVYIGHAPGVNGRETWSPRWSNDVRFFTVNGPWPRNYNFRNWRSNVYLGKFDEKFTKVTDWVQVTHSPAAEICAFARVGVVPNRPQAVFAAPATVRAGQPLLLSDIRYQPGWGQRGKTIGAVTGRIFCRRPGAGKFTRFKLTREKKNLLKGAIPGRVTKAPFEYYVKLQPVGLEAAYGPLTGPEDPLRVTPDASPPSPPGNLQVTERKSYAVKLRWTAAKDDLGVKAYRVLRGRRERFSLASGRVLGELGEEVLACTDANPPAGRTAWYVVQAIDVAGRKGQAAFLKVDVPKDMVPINALKLTATPSSKSAILSWTGELEPDVSQIEILRAIGAGTALRPIAKIDDVKKTVHVDRELDPGKAYRYALRLVDRGGHVSLAGKPVSVRPLIFLKRINCGGLAYVGPDGIPWEADRRQRDGTNFFSGNFPVTGAGGLKTIYQSERWANQRVPFDVEVEPGRYEIVFHFAETNTGFARKGARTFDILINGRPVRKKVDIFDQAGGGNKALLLRETVEVKGRRLRITLRAASAGPAIKALEVRGLANED